MASRAITGRKAAVYLTLGNAIATGPTAMTWSASAKTATCATKQFIHSDVYPFTVLLDGVLAIGTADIAPGTAINSVIVASFTANLGGSEVTVASDSTASLTVSSTPGQQIVYAITYDGSSITSVAGTDGVASLTRGAAGGPPFIPVGSIALGYVVRANGSATTITTSEISMSLYDGRQWANNPSYFELRPLLGRADFDALPAAVHTGSTYPAIYASGRTFADNYTKVGQLIDFSLSHTVAREDATVQNGGATESDRGRKSYSFSANKFISSIADEIFTHQNENDVDIILKILPDRVQTTKYLICQASLDSAMDFPNAEKQKSAITGNITGYVEELP